MHVNVRVKERHILPRGGLDTAETKVGFWCCVVFELECFGGRIVDGWSKSAQGKVSLCRCR